MKSLDRHVDLLRHDAWEVSKKIYELNDYIDKLREECKYWKDQFLRVNELSVEVSEFIENNFTNSDGTIWHEDMKKIYNILGWSEDDEKDSNKRTSKI